MGVVAMLGRLGSLGLHDINLDGDERDELDTVGGLVITTAGYVPVRGEVIAHESGLEFEVLDSDPRRVNIVRISGLNAQNNTHGSLVVDV